MNVPMERAYREACLALGEALVRERLLIAEVQRLEAAALARSAEAAGEAGDD